MDEHIKWIKDFQNKSFPFMEKFQLPTQDTVYNVIWILNDEWRKEKNQHQSKNVDQLLNKYNFNIGSKFGKQDNMEGGVKNIIRNTTRKSTFQNIITRSRKAGSILQKDISPEKITSLAQAQAQQETTASLSPEITQLTTGPVAQHQSPDKNYKFTQPPKPSLSEYVFKNQQPEQLSPALPSKKLTNSNFNSQDKLLRLQEAWKDFEVIPE